jgi:hypothetical protein
VALLIAAARWPEAEQCEEEELVLLTMVADAVADTESLRPPRDFSVLAAKVCCSSENQRGGPGQIDVPN